MEMPRPLNTLFVTGSAGFIGSHFVHQLLRDPLFSGKIIGYDLLTYAADPLHLKGIEKHPRYTFIQGDIRNQLLVQKIFEEHPIDAVVHFAAESHVDRSIEQGAPFLETNVFGTFALLEVIKQFPEVHFHHVSTDEVYGALGKVGVFRENSPYRPNSPYAASKAASDHFVRAYAQTYGLSTTISHCSNNFGPRQHREKLIPKVLLHALSNAPIPIYGEGKQVREWIFVEDHVDAIWKILQFGKKGAVYNIAGIIELSNLKLVTSLLELLSFQTKVRFSHYESLLRFVQDRPGHDFRYALDSTKMEKELGWKAKVSLKEGLKRTIRSYHK